MSKRNASPPRFRSSRNKQTLEPERVTTAPARQKSNKQMRNTHLHHNSEVVSRVTKDFGFFSNNSSFDLEKSKSSSYKVLKGRRGKSSGKGGFLLCNGVENPFPTRSTSLDFPLPRNCVADEDPFPMPPGAAEEENPFPLPRNCVAGDNPFPMPSNSADRIDNDDEMKSNLTTSSMTSIPLPAPNDELFPMPPSAVDADSDSTSSSSEEEVLLGPAAQWREKRKIRRKPVHKHGWGEASSPRMASKTDSPPTISNGSCSPDAVPSSPGSSPASSIPVFTATSGSMGRNVRRPGSGITKKKLAPLGVHDMMSPKVSNKSPSGEWMRPGTASANSPSNRHRHAGFGEQSSEFLHDYSIEESIPESPIPVKTPARRQARPASSRPRSPFVSETYEMGFKVGVGGVGVTGMAGMCMPKKSGRSLSPRNTTPAMNMSSNRGDYSARRERPSSSKERPKERPGSSRRDRPSAKDRPGTSKPSGGGKRRERSERVKRASSPKTSIKNSKHPPSPHGLSLTSSIGSMSLERSQHVGGEAKAKDSSERVRSASANRKKNRAMRPPSRQLPPPEALHLDKRGALKRAEAQSSPRSRIIRARRDKQSPQTTIGAMWTEFRISEDDNDLHVHDLDIKKPIPLEEESD